MVKSCCVKYCKSEFYAGCGISFHNFPKDEDRKKKWLDIVPSSQKITKNSVVCSNHFKKEDFHEACSRKLLKEHVIPSIFPLVLQSFKKLHRTRLKVFAGDKKALAAARIKINEEFNKNKHVTDEESIKAMIKFSEDVEKELRTHIIQAREIKLGLFEAKITEDTEKLDNIPFIDSHEPDNANSTSGNRPCCQDQALNK